MVGPTPGQKDVEALLACALDHPWPHTLKNELSVARRTPR
jgi:hypothetical protein